MQINMQYNTCVSRMMELINALYKYDLENDVKNVAFMADCARDLMLMISPFAPHFAEEMWEQSGYPYSIFNQQWPEYDEKALILDTVEIAIQINGKIRDKIDISSSLTKAEIEALVVSNDTVKAAIGDKKIVKIIVVPQRLVNIVVR